MLLYNQIMSMRCNNPTKDLTRLDESNDIYTDALILVGKQKERPCYKCAYNNLRKMVFQENPNQSKV